jgi:glycosyltransferase involved in cell wall biosynthesis
VSFIKSVTEHFTLITPSLANERSLKEVLPQAKFEVLYGIQTRKIQNSLNPVGDFKKFIEGKFVVGGAGRFVEQKGVDLFLKVAEETVTPDRNIVFVWVGGPSGFKEGKDLSLLEERMRDHLSITGTLDHVMVVPFNSTPQKYFKCFDLFFLSSRWDPFPLTVLENAELGVPTICYSNAGGAPEFVGDSCGVVVDFESVTDVVNCILHLREDNEKLNFYRVHCKRNISNYDVGYLKNQLSSILNQG